MQYGVVRIIAEELRWLSVSGRYTEFSEATWRTSDRSVGYGQARCANGLLLKIPDSANSVGKNARESRQNRSDESSALLIPASPAELQSVAARLKRWRLGS